MNESNSKEIKNKHKRSVVYIGIITIVLLHAYFATFFDKNLFAPKYEVLFKIIWLASFVSSFVVFRIYIYEYICKIINNKK